MSASRVADILVERDGDSFDQAMERVKECAVAIKDSGYNIAEADLILRDYIGLEPDYLFDVLETLE